MSTTQKGVQKGVQKSVQKGVQPPKRMSNILNKYKKKSEQTQKVDFKPLSLSIYTIYVYIYICMYNMYIHIINKVYEGRPENMSIYI